MLTSEKIKLRALEPADVEVLYQWENSPEIWQVSGTVIPFSRETLRKYIETAADIYADKQFRFVICLNDSEKPIGCIDLFEFDVKNQRAGIGILIAEQEERGKGYASDAIQLLINYSFSHLHLHQLFCNIAKGNEISLKLFEKYEFEKISVKKDWLKTENGWLDEHFLQLINPNS
ncbi:MAG: GNAT family N-acetyltransferase [Flavobacteriales bacterium]|nr:MAG: GNAT family N-acetyltransferase [Flavobacteriales bacterium]